MSDAGLAPIPEAHRAALEPLLARAVTAGLDDAACAKWIAMLNTLPVMTHGACEGRLHPQGLVAIAVPALKPWHLGGFSGTRQVANGAAISGIMDGVFGAAANVHALSAGSDGAATVDLSIQLMRPTLGPGMTAYGVATSVGFQLVFTEGVLVDGQGSVTARGTATCMIPQKRAKAS